MDISIKIKNKYNELLQLNRVETVDKLNEYHEKFRDKFSTERLKNLDGEELMNLMFDHSNKNSLVYWLEFKNDDEFNINLFGGIGGGSALKFGIYKRKDDGKWITGIPRDQKEINIDEAIIIAKEKEI